MRRSFWGSGGDGCFWARACAHEALMVEIELKVVFSPTVSAGKHG